MIEHEVLTLQIFSTVKLLAAAFILFIWLPRKVLPQDHVDNTLDRFMFNIIHMVALITLVFPLFIYLRVFGLFFFILFFIVLKLVLLKFYYKRNLYKYFGALYHEVFTGILKVLEHPRTYATFYQHKILRTLQSARSRTRTENGLLLCLLSLVIMYSSYVLLLRGYISLVSPVPDLYSFYYWHNMLNINTLFSKIAGAPYMWSGPVMIYTVNLFANLNAVVIYNLFPVLYLSFLCFSIIYFAKKFFDTQIAKTASFLIMLVFFTVVIPSPLASEFFGLVYETQWPDILSISVLSFHGGQNISPGDHLKEFLPFLFYWRLTSSLPYEVAACFFLINVYFLVQYLETRKSIYAVLYAETLAIVFSIHGGVAIALFFPSALIFMCYLTALRFTLRTLATLSLAITLATVIGNLWTLQFFIYGPPTDVGAAAPILDRLFQTERQLRELTKTNIYSAQLVRPTILQISLGLLSVLILIIGAFSKKNRFQLFAVSLTSLGILALYFQQNLGLPKLVDHSRLQIFMAISYSLVFGLTYHLLVEKHFLFLLFRRSATVASLVVAGCISIAAIIATPRWIDTDHFWTRTYNIEHKEFPFITHKIAEDFYPFTFTIVSYVQQFPQVIASGYHINTQDFIQQFSPVSGTLDIETDYIFLFSENVPKEFEGLGEYWYRWRRDIMMKLKDWIALYSQNHENIKLYYRSREAEVYVITNKNEEDLLRRQRKELRDIRR